MFFFATVNFLWVVTASPLKLAAQSCECETSDGAQLNTRLLTSGMQTQPECAVNTGEWGEEVTQTADANTHLSPSAPFTNTACHGA